MIGNRKNPQTMPGTGGSRLMRHHPLICSNKEATEISTVRAKGDGQSHRRVARSRPPPLFLDPISGNLDSSSPSSDLIPPLITLLPLPPPLLVNPPATSLSLQSFARLCYFSSSLLSLLLSVAVHPLLAMPTTSALGTGPLEVRLNKVIESLVDQIDLSEEEAEVCLKLLLNEANEALISAFSKSGNVDNSVKCNCADLFQRLFRFHDSMDAYAEQRALVAFVLAVVVDGHRWRQEACIQANFLSVSLKHLQIANPSDGQTEPLLLHGFVYVRASAIFILGALIDVVSVTFDDGHRVDEDFNDNEKLKSELNIIKYLVVVPPRCVKGPGDLPLSLHLYSEFIMGLDNALFSLTDCYMLVLEIEIGDEDEESESSDSESNDDLEL
ncbi:hypothetical protein ZIOFF_009879 [Zingiber officinale]|uniref:Uncharacterized protein n=1 Tax=Zingiber officinale TaxID=94328 RepID=A0A8J5HNR7_ZINOF|nr:hypothetical protein ZIOFF_009879 [Zingiber officinale]